MTSVISAEAGIDPGLKPLFVFDASIDPPVVIDGAASRRFIRITGGTVSGAYTGRILSAGGDWHLRVDDETIELNAHYILDIDGHGHVEVRSRGLRHAAPDVAAAINRGEDVDPALYYFRTTMRFRTAAPGLVHLNRIIAVTAAKRLLARVILNVFEVT
jgi:hypothetical protein